MKRACLAALVIFPLVARDPLAQRIVHTDPAKARPSKAVHDGAGTVDIQALFNDAVLDTNLYFLHRGVIEPKSGIGAHFHNQCEEMFIIFDGEAQFTIDGRTSVLKGPAGAPCRMGHSHAVYNPGDKPLQWMNINVSAMKGTYDAFNLSDPRVDVQIDPIPTFMAMRLDRALLRPMPSINGGNGTAQYRRALDTSVFSGPWAYVDHLVLPPKTSAGSHLHHEVAEVYYVMNGSGMATITSNAVPGGAGPTADSAPIHAGDAIPIHLNELHSFENNGTEPLEFMIIGVSRDRTKRVDSIDAKDLPRRAN